MKMPLRLLIDDRKGQDMIEYALISAFIAACVVALGPAISSTSTYFSTVVNILNLAISQTSGS
jgi:Flp pilus assembly pilin Flp